MAETSDPIMYLHRSLLVRESALAQLDRALGLGHAGRVGDLDHPLLALPLLEVQAGGGRMRQDVAAHWLARVCVGQRVGGVRHDLVGQVDCHVELL